MLIHTSTSGYSNPQHYCICSYLNLVLSYNPYLSFPFHTYHTTHHPPTHPHTHTSPHLITFAQDVALLAKQKALVLMESILQAHDQRTALVSQYHDAIAGYKQSKEGKGYKNTKRSLDDRFRTYTENIDSLGKQLQEMDSEKSFKVGNINWWFLVCHPPYIALSVTPLSLSLQLAELQKKSNELKHEVDESYQLAENLVVGGMSKQQYLERERSNQAHLNRLQNEIDTIVQGLGL